jgi:hypothetical protein
VHPDADREVIEAAYRQLMRKYLSDIAGGDTVRAAALHKRATAINQAHAVLRDPGSGGFTMGCVTARVSRSATQMLARGTTGLATGTRVRHRHGPDHRTLRAPTPCNDPYAVPEVLAYTDPGRITSPST